MQSSANPADYTGAGALARAALKIAAAAPHRAGAVPALLVLTDPQRLPDPVHLAAHLPAGAPGGCAIIYRHFGDPDAATISARAAAICAARGLGFLVSWAPDMALPPGTGVHVPQNRHNVLARLRQSVGHHPLTAAAHSLEAAQAAIAAGANAVLLSPVFSSACAGSGKALGAQRFAAIAKACPGPLYALGGITASNAALLQGHAAGLAVVSAVLP